MKWDAGMHVGWEGWGSKEAEQAKSEGLCQERVKMRQK